MLQFIGLFRVRHDLAIEKQKYVIIINLLATACYIRKKKYDFGAKKITSTNLLYKAGDIGKANWPLGP